MKGSPSLSAVIIAKDEELDLPVALASLKGLADEIVVLVGTESSDRTFELAREAGAVVRRRAFDTFAGQKQAALELASRDWVLSIDADEAVSPELRRWMLDRLSGVPDDAAGFELPFEVWFLGRRLRFGGLGSERHLRLFRRTRGRFVGGLLHEGVELDGRLGEPPKGRIIHTPYRNLDDYLAKLSRYTTLAARKRYEAGRRFSPWMHLVLPAEFFKRAILRLGILDGFPGVAWAALSAFHSWLKYAKLKEIEDLKP